MRVVCRGISAALRRVRMSGVDRTLHSSRPSKVRQSARAPGRTGDTPRTACVVLRARGGFDHRASTHDWHIGGTGR